MEYARKRQDLLVFMTPMESEKEYEKLDAFLSIVEFAVVLSRKVGDFGLL